MFEDEAWVYDARTSSKRRRTFESSDRAKQWRLDELYKMYGRPADTNGRLDKAYTLLRKAAQELDGAISTLESREARVSARSALSSVYEASDRTLVALASC